MLATTTPYYHIGADIGRCILMSWHCNITTRDIATDIGDIGTDVGRCASTSVPMCHDIGTDIGRCWLSVAARANPFYHIGADIGRCTIMSLVL